MRELIYRDEAIEAIHDLYAIHGSEGSWIDQKDAFNAVSNLPPAQPEQKWIPVSERLPEEGGEYLTSVYHIVGPISVFHPEDDTYVSDVAIMKFYDKFPSTVRAWMPLPEPYEVGRNE